MVAPFDRSGFGFAKILCSPGVNPRWALPGKIAASKSYTYVWQDEFRSLSVSD